MNRQGYQASRVRRILAGAVLTAVLSHFIPESVGLSFTAGILYTAVALFWTLTLAHRVGPDHTKRLMVTIGIMLTVLFVLQIYKYAFAPRASFSWRLSWFGYYIPYISIPVLSFLAAVSIDRGYMPSPWDKPLLIACGVFSLVVLTNDWHQLLQVYVGVNARGDLIARPGPLYYFAMTWVAVFSIAAVVAIFRRLRVAELRRKILMPALIAGLGILICILFVRFFEDTTFPFIGVRPFRVNDLVLIVTITAWEAAFRSGLVPSNEDYEGIFTRMELNAAIGTPDGTVALRSAGAAITEEQMKKTLEGPVSEGGMRFSSRKVRGGRVYWADDLHQVERLEKELAGVNAELEESVNLLKKERELVSERASLKARKDLHEGIYQAMEPKLQRIEEQVAACRHMGGAELRDALAELCVLGTYVKRAVNLRLIEANGETPGAEDLALSMAESLRYASLLGVDAEALREDFLHQQKDPHESPAAAYDRFEVLAEQALAAQKGGQV